MALSANTVWEVRGTVLAGSPGPGLDSNGGGFVAGSGGTDFSQQNAAQVAVGGGVVTSSVTTNVFTFTGGTYTVLAGDVGNIVQVISGTNTTPGFFQITSVGAGLNGTWTMDRNVVSAGTQTNVVANMGGALGGTAVNSGLAKLATAMVASNKAFITGSYTTNASVTWTQGVGTPIAGTPPTHLIGYGLSRGDNVKATITLQTNTGQCPFTISTNHGWSFDNLSIDCGSLGTSTGFSLANFRYMKFRNCKVANFTTNGINFGNSLNIIVENCEFTGGTAAATNGALFVSTSSGVWITSCFIHDNACPGIIISATGQADVVSNCLICNNSGASSDGVQLGYGNQALSNTIHNNGRDGIRLLSANDIGVVVLNNLLTSNGGYGFNSSGGSFPAQFQYDGNAYYNNTSGTRNAMDAVTGIYGVSPYTNVRDVTLTASPYVGPTTGGTANFALNNTAGGGAACRAAGSPGAFPGLATTVGNLDMGAVQSRGGIIGNPSLEGIGA